MQVEHDGLRAETVLPNGGHPVDPHGFVDVFDPLLDGAHIGVGQSVAVSKVQRDACPRPVALHGTNTFRKLASLFINHRLTHISYNFLLETWR